VVAQSTAEAEFVAASMAVKDIMWLHKLSHEWLILRQIITLFCHIESALKTMSGEKHAMPARVKHIDVQYWGIQDHVMKGDVKPTFVSSHEMLADGLTKALFWSYGTDQHQAR
jgi:acyl carrier protein phosphodiesterase